MNQIKLLILTIGVLAALALGMMWPNAPIALAQEPTPTPPPGYTCQQVVASEDMYRYSDFWWLTSSWPAWAGPTTSIDGQSFISGIDSLDGYIARVINWPGSADYALLSTDVTEQGVYIPNGSFSDVIEATRFHVDGTGIRLGFHWVSGSPGSLSGTIVEFCIADEEPDPVDLCPLVENAHFAAEDGWLLAGGSVITDSLLSLPVGGQTAQNLTLTSLTAYNAVISTSVTTAIPTSVDVTLGTQSQTIAITGAGRFTASFTTPTLGGPIAYELENTGANGVDLDFTCVFTATDGSTGDCIAPTNGTFDTADNWYWYRNAAWDSFSKKAGLPYNSGGDIEASLVQASIAYTMPVLTDTQYLILGFQAQSADEVGLISSKVGTSESEHRAYPVPYDYEVDISTQAGQSVEIAFADSGTSDLLLDNVCIFISDDPPNLPAPDDPDGIGNGIDFGFNYTCNDVPALLAGFGINVYGAQATFEAGVSVWEPQYYIPWLAAALWSNAGRPISCFIIEHMRLAAGIGQQQINEFLNYVNWSVRSANASAPWLQLGFAYLKNTIFNPAVAFRTTAAGWLPWWSNQIRSVLTSVGSNWLITINWIREAAIYVSDAAFGSGEGLADEFPGVGSGFGLLDMVWAMVDLVWWIWNWIYTNVILMISIPKEFMDAFDEGVQAEPFADLVSCSSGNFWCLFLSGVQLVNQTVSDSILYPIVIVGSILITFMVLWEDFWRIVSIEVK